MGVVGKLQVDISSLTLIDSGVGELLISVHFVGAVTLKFKVDFMSGCSKTGKTLLESATSN
jgi:hypothetical protein